MVLSSVDVFKGHVSAFSVLFSEEAGGYCFLRTSHTDPRLITRSDKSNQQPPPPRTGRITGVTSAFQGVSLPQETARDMSQRFLSERTHSPFITACDSEKSLPQPQLRTVHKRGYNLQAAALLGGKVIRLHPKGGEMFLSPLLFF